MNWGHPEYRKILLLLGDLSLSMIAAAAAMLVHPGYHVAAAQRVAAVALFALVFPACFYVFDLFDLTALTRLKTISRLFMAGILGSFIASFFFYFGQWLGASRGSMAIAVPALLAMCYGWRRFYARHAQIFADRRPVLLIGSPERARQLRSDLAARGSNYDLAGFLWSEPGQSAGEELRLTGSSASELEIVSPGGAAKAKQGKGIALEPVARTGTAVRALLDSSTEPPASLGTLSAEGLQEIVWGRAIHTVIIQSDSLAADLAPCLARLRFHGVRIARIPDFYNHLSEELPLDAISDSWLSFADGFYLVQTRFFRRLKRLGDILLATIGLILSLPISLAAALAVKLDSPGPVLFQQWRVGWMEQPFKLFKFRSMRSDAEPDGRARWASVDDPRVTRVGRILRTLHIDEIPQMVNVLRGDMSFVGPRPERPVFVQELKAQIPFYELRHFVPPGITGWAQVNYRYGASVPDARRKLQFDLYYIRNASPAMDLRIVLRTIRSVLFRHGSR